MVDVHDDGEDDQHDSLKGAQEARVLLGRVGGLLGEGVGGEDDRRQPRRQQIDACQQEQARPDQPHPRDATKLGSRGAGPTINSAQLQNIQGFDIWTSVLARCRHVAAFADRYH